MRVGNVNVHCWPADVRACVLMVMLKNEKLHHGQRLPHHVNKVAAAVWHVQLTTAAQYRKHTGRHFLCLCCWTYQQGSYSDFRPYATTCDDDAASSNGHCLLKEALAIVSLLHKHQMLQCWNDRRHLQWIFFLQIYFCESLTIKIKILLKTIVANLIKKYFPYFTKDGVSLPFS